jgi:hypothetical protein
MNLYIRLNTLSFKVPIFEYFTIPHHTSKTYTHIHLSCFLTIFNMFLTISQANASTTAMTNITPASSDMLLESLIYTDPTNYPYPSSMPSCWMTLTMMVHFSFHLCLSLPSVLLPCTSSKMSTKRVMQLAKVKPKMMQLRASSNSRDSTLASLPPLSNNAEKKPNNKYLTSLRPRPL